MQAIPQICQSIGYFTSIFRCQIGFLRNKCLFFFTVCGKPDLPRHHLASLLLLLLLLSDSDGMADGKSEEEEEEKGRVRCWG